MKQAILIGADIELFGIPPDAQNSTAMWDDWLGRLLDLPPKGERLDLGMGVWTHRDGLSAEYGFEPCVEVEQFIAYRDTGKQLVEQALELPEPIRPLDRFNVSTVKTLPEAATLLELGCDPDFEVTEQSPATRREVSLDVVDSETRECGGHLHISLPPMFLNAPELLGQFIRELDAIVYPMAYPDTTREERTWYRQRRVYRPKPYGVEYRSIGAAGLFGPLGPEIVEAALAMARQAWEV